MNTLQAVTAYHARGWVPVPLHPRGKRPEPVAWQDLRPTADELPRLFGPDSNVGILLGPSGVVDVDLDCPEAVELAPALLPATPLRFGRDGAPASHWLYVCAGAAYEKLNLKRETLVELRAGDGKQTVVPPSIHPTGQVVRWEVGVDPDADPATVDAWFLASSVRRLAAACLFVRDGYSAAGAVQAVQAVAPPAHMPNGQAGDRIRTWCGWPAAQSTQSAQRGRTPAPDPDAKLELKDAAQAYVRDNPTEYPTRNSTCPVCQRPGGFKVSNDVQRWTCWSSHHPETRVGIEAADHWSGDVLDLDAHAAGMSVPEFLRDRGYLRDRPLPRRPLHEAADAEPTEDPPPDPPALAALGLQALERALDAIAAAQDDTDKGQALAALHTDPDPDGLHLGAAMLHHEAEFNALISQIEVHLTKLSALRRVEVTARGARAKLEKLRRQGEPDDAARMFWRGDEVEIAKSALQDYLGEHTVYDRSALHRYDPDAGAWLDYERHHIVTVLMRYAGAPVYAGPEKPARALKMSNSSANGSAKLIESSTRRREFFDRRATGCGFRNGFLRADGTWLEKSSDHRLIESDVLPFDYRSVPNFDDIPGAAPRFSRFLLDLFAEDDDAHDKARVIMQFVGATMLGLATRYEMALLLWGPTAGNGKSTLMRVIGQLFSPRARCSVPPHLMGERFENVSLATARANLVNDMPDAELIDSGNLKAIVSGDELQWNPKNLPPFMAAPRAGHVFAANNLPAVRDRSRGFWRRMLVVSFNRCFDTSPERDPDMARKVLAEREAIAAACLRCALDLVGRGGSYDVPASSRELLADWERGANNVREFAEGFEPVGTSLVALSGRLLYAAYKLHCQDGGSRPLGRNKFYDELRREGWVQAAVARRPWLVTPTPGSEAELLIERARRLRR